MENGLRRIIIKSLALIVSVIVISSTSEINARLALSGPSLRQAPEYYEISAGQLLPGSSYPSMSSNLNDVLVGELLALPNEYQRDYLIDYRQQRQQPTAQQIDDEPPRVSIVEPDSKLSDLIWQLSSSGPNGEQPLNQLEFEPLSGQSIVDDVNAHLPASDQRVPQPFSGPINDPAEFEATMGQFTDLLNHGQPNSVNWSVLLDNSLANYRLDVGAADMKVGPNLTTDLVAELSQLLGSSLDLVGGAEEQRRLPATSSERPPNSSSGDSNRLVRVSAAHYDGREYIDELLALAGHQYVQGGAGEGLQLLGPDGTFENIQVIKSDHAAPSYCDPPNPCPIGYTAQDGCLERFANSASFSREYQAKQHCSCDNEHSLFNCAAGPGDKSLNNDNNDQENGNGGDTQRWSKLDTLARTIQNRFGDLSSIRNLIANHEHEMGDKNADWLARSAPNWSKETK